MQIGINEIYYCMRRKEQINARHRVIKDMHMKRGGSLPKITSGNILKKPPSRLQFPRKDDTNLYHGFGRKHYLLHNQTSEEKISHKKIQETIQNYRRRNIRMNSEVIAANYNSEPNSPAKQYKSIQRNESEIPQAKIVNRKQMCSSRQSSEPSAQNNRPRERLATDNTTNAYKIKYQLKIDDLLHKKSNITNNQPKQSFLPGNNQSRIPQVPGLADKIKYRNPTFLSTEFFS